MKKIISFCLCLSCLLAIGVSAVGCDNQDSDNGTVGGYKTYVMEAEYIDLENVQGGGVSYEAAGVNTIEGSGSEADKAKGWSNGYFLKGLDADGLELEFVFNSATATSGVSLILRLGNENETRDFNSEIFSVKLNGEEIEYNTITLNGPYSLADIEFNDYTVATNLNLKEGENVITLTVHSDSAGTYTVGPRIDCIKLKSKSALTWTDKTDNPDRRGEI